MSLAGQQVLSGVALVLTTTIMMMMTTLGGVQVAEGVPFKYHSHTGVARVLKQFKLKYPKLTKVHSIGRSFKGKELWVLVIGKHYKGKEPLIPNVKYIANMHGNEVVGREMLLHLADYFLVQYSKNDTIRNFLDTTTVHLMPTMNPDGYELANENDCMSIVGRGNDYRYDLNRNFPDPYIVVQPPLQRETALVMNWIHSNRFLLSANLHGGAEVVNYPWDSLKGDMTRAQYAASPDDDVFRHLSLIFSRSHPTMHQGTSCGDYFQDGITNGANWYPISGGMADYMYRNASGYELLIEMSCCKYPDASTLPDFWTKNKDAMVNLLFAVHIGVKGIVSTVVPGINSTMPDMIMPVLDAKVVIHGREEVVFHTTDKGEYYKLLMPGDYILKVSHEDFKPLSVMFTVSSGNVTVLNIRLKAHLPSVPQVISSSQKSNTHEATTAINFTKASATTKATTKTTTTFSSKQTESGDTAPHKWDPGLTNNGHRPLMNDINENQDKDDATENQEDDVEITSTTAISKESDSPANNHGDGVIGRVPNGLGRLPPVTDPGQEEDKSTSVEETTSDKFDPHPLTETTVTERNIKNTETTRTSLNVMPNLFPGNLSPNQLETTTMTPMPEQNDAENETDHTNTMLGNNSNIFRLPPLFLLPSTVKTTLTTDSKDNSTATYNNSNNGRQPETFVMEPGNSSVHVSQNLTMVLCSLQFLLIALLLSR